MTSKRQARVHARILQSIGTPMAEAPKATKGRSRRAAVMTEDDLQSALDAARHPLAIQPERDVLLILMTHRLGLRIGEAARARAEHILDAAGNVKDSFFVPANHAKNGYDRELVIAPETSNSNGDLKRALVAYMAKYKIRKGPIFFNLTGEPLTGDCARKQVKAIYERAKLIGCSSHSGRRSFATRAAKVLAEANCNIRDLQYGMGHAFMSTTEGYIERTGNLRRLAELI